jgi:hypothetical protein
MKHKKERRLVVTREAAKFLGLSMRRVNALAASGHIWSTKKGPFLRAYDLDDLIRYKAERDEARDAGSVRGALPQGKPAAESRIVVAPGEPVMLTREAATYLGCSMKHLRLLASTGKIACRKLGPASLAFPVSDLTRYRSTTASLRKAGKARGRPPAGFKADPQP